jgi:flagellar export protein FliJ
MKKFVFKFSAVMKVRKAKETEALRSLSTAQKAYQAEVQKKMRLADELQRSFQRREKLSSVLAQGVSYQAEQAYSDGLKIRMSQADQSIFRSNREFQKRLRSYIYARQQSKAIESLYEKAYEEHKKSLAKQEQKEVDDMVVMRAHLKEELL